MTERTIRVADIGGTAEVAQLCGVERSTASNWNTRNQWNFPKPVWSIAATSVWDLAAVRAWKLTDDYRRAMAAVDVAGRRPRRKPRV